MIRFSSLFILLLFGIGCKEELNFPIEPYIEFRSIEIKKTNAPFPFDTSIEVTFYFRDGDFDLGLTYKDSSPPYNLINYFFKSGEISDHFDNSRLGDYISYKLKREQKIDSLPNFAAPHDCTSWSIQRDQNNNVIDTLYVKFNEYFSNLFVDLFFESSNGFIKYEFSGPYPNCDNYGFNFRFPPPFFESPPSLFSTKISSKEGLMTFKIYGDYYKSILSGRKIFFKLKIVDRSLHESNVVETDKLQF